MDGKYFYGISGSLFLVTFIVVMVTLEVVKPKWILKKSQSYDEEPKEVDHLMAALYSFALALLISIVYALIGNFYVKHDVKLPRTVHSSLVLIGSFIIVYLVLFFVKPKFVQSQSGGSGLYGDEESIDPAKTAMFSAIIAIVIAIIDFLIYKKKKGLFEAPSASCFEEPALSSSHKQHYKMSFPMKCGM